MMQPFAELGALIERRWCEQNYDENSFPAIAAGAISELQPSSNIDPWEIIKWVHSTPNLPEQMDLPGKFGNPPITVYVGPRFYIDVYYWLDGTTTIHQHAFSGAFQVLLGGSLHAEYRFDQRREINPHFLTGNLSLKKVSLLAKDDIREIRPGPEFIHSLFHLERPSVTLTVRTYKAPGDAVQYAYLKPFLAINPFFTDPALAKKVQTASLLLRMKHPQADSIIGKLVESSDFQTTYAVLEQAFEFLCHRELEEIVGVSRSADRFEALLDRARGKHGELAELLPPVFEESWRQREITRRRSEIKSEEHRFFLALLLNVPERTSLVKLVKEKFPDREVVDLIVEWVRELSSTRIFGSKEPNVLGVELGQRHLSVFKGLLEGLTIEEIRAQAGKSSDAGSTDLTVDALTNQLKTAPLFARIF